ncbi:AGE family epimerase/isomerase [Paenibacillus glycanilyticus]|uniref:AGE family epimerase/isomerase n=1 Tax=Paenibacillus glycanilyticus TaxID=126569 RepID=UPI00203C1AB0|nr:AGE family epimerase/isomerase [Paenibacillus glycanilyticus]MCM3627203.1 AGE family epimerase/isomerase [Paenibacillus glycanilyticus]
MEQPDWRSWQQEIESELKENILSFWMKHTRDERNGGFLGGISNELKVNAEADKSLVLNTRILWTYASAYRKYKDTAYLEMAERAYEYLNSHFHDNEHGGYYWLLNYAGEPVQTKKQIYGQAFMIYALAEYVRARPDEEALQEAVRLFEFVERYSYDASYKGYIEALSCDWEATDDLSLSHTDLNEKKSMNTHLHVLEAYTNLFRVWPSERLEGKLKELIETMLDHIVDEETRHFKLFFDEAWHSKSHEISYGHDIEGSWLLTEAAEVLGHQELIRRTERIALAMAQAVYEEGVDTDGAIVNEADPNGWTDTDKIWWPQAEAVVGFLNAYQLSGQAHFLQAAYRTWVFIDRCMVDKTNGEWFWKVNQAGEPSGEEMKVDPWKCPYHNGRMGLEALERIEKLVKEPVNE